MERCSWAKNNKLMRRYHDTEWGRIVKNDQKLFEFLVLEGAQAGLSWQTILNRRNGYKKAFLGFNVKKVALMKSGDVNRLVKNPEIIRNRLKIKSAINNAQKFLEVQKEFGSFYKYLQNFKPKKHRSTSDLVVTSRESDALSKNLKKRGFNFVGSTIMYAFMQAVGMVNDHLPGCYLYNRTYAQAAKYRQSRLS